METEASTNKKWFQLERKQTRPETRAKTQNQQPQLPNMKKQKRKKKERKTGKENEELLTR